MTIIKPSIKYSADSIKNCKTIVLLCDEKNAVGSNAKKLKIDKIINNATKIEGFKGGFAKKIEIINADNSSNNQFDKIIVIGLGKISKMNEYSWCKIGGVIANLNVSDKKIAVLAEMPNSKNIEAENVANIAVGIKLGCYRFTRHKTSKDIKHKEIAYILHSQNARKASVHWNKVAEHIADGAIVARDLVNEPANMLTPKQFVKEAEKLKKLGAKVEVIDQSKMKKLKMNALLGVAQGSVNPPYLVVIKWNGGKNKSGPLAFVGKGVTFDTGGISIKPSGGMEDMKGDMGGAAAVTGLMHTLAARKAKVNVVGILGLVENMPDGNAQRPGDIVTSMSGKTIEVLNTDAEGRLVLADALTYCQKQFKPKMMINLATLTGAILVALGNHHAGVFSNDDKLADNLFKAGQKTQEKVWRMPLGPEYDKLIDSKNADVKNIGGGRYAGSITAGQFLQRFVEGKTPWAHLDVAGTAMDSPQNEINKSWASGFGVRLLNQLVKDVYE